MMFFLGGILFASLRQLPLALGSVAANEMAVSSLCSTSTTLPLLLLS
jgi:hypothetical protein